MRAQAAVTVNKPREAVERLWHERKPVYVEEADAVVSFADAPGDRGTEIHVDLERDVPAGRLGEAVVKVAGSDPLAKLKDDLRHFKQRVETGEIARSAAGELEQAGAR
jgi:uncharacterized membrane protein